MENILENSLLFDFYGELLTKKQKNIFDLYMQEDLSFSEIAEELDITRQSVYDTIKKTKCILLNYEEKLGLVKRFTYQNIKLDEVIDKLKKLDMKNNNKIVEIISDIEILMK